MYASYDELYFTMLNISARISMLLNKINVEESFRKNIRLARCKRKISLSFKLFLLYMYKNIHVCLR